jgi:hypothetical protein
MNRWSCILVVLLVAAHPAVAEPSFTGTWDTTYGRLVLTQDGPKVRGFYVYGGRKSTVEGQVEKSKLTFRYQEPDSKGEGWFELAADEKSFIGQWRQDGETEWGQWNGRRISASTEPLTTFDGLWETSYGRMRLVQRDGHVEGGYSSVDSTITGKLDGKKLTFRYQEPEAKGEGWFELAADGRSFHGKWRSDGSMNWSDWTGKRIEPIPGQVWLVIIEANWESSLADPEYSFGAMLKAFFARAPSVQVRHRFFTDETSFRKWCREVAYLAEPVVVSLATHGSRAGASVGGHTIGAKAIADSFRYATNIRVLNFSACEMMKDRLAREVVDALDKDRRFPISGYTTSVDWAASAIVEFAYYELILVRDMPPEQAMRQVKKLLPFAGDKRISGGSAFAPLGFRLLMPGEPKPAAGSN